MPQFILEGGNLPEFRALDYFTQGYIEAAFFTIGDELEFCGFADLADSTLSRIIADCGNFQDVNRGTLAQAYIGPYDEMQAGRDFWFTRNGHGVGYWDRQELAEWIRDALTESASAMPELDLYQGDDESLYLA